MKPLLIVLILLKSGFIISQENLPKDSVKPKDIYSIGVGSHYGFVFAHSVAVKNTKGSRPWAIEVDLSRQLVNNTAWKDCGCYPRTGLSISYFNLDNKILGHSINVAAYVEPFLSTSHRFNFSMKGAAGVSYLTNPYHEEKNPENMSYSTRISSYLSMGLGLNMKIDQHVSAKISAYYNHISNGGVKEPNKGVNWPAATLHVYYAFNPTPLPQDNINKTKEYKKKPLRKDVFIYASQKTIYLITGGGVNVSKQISGMNAINLGAEVIADYAMKKRMNDEGINNNSYKHAGILAGHEFLMGKFIFSQQIGVYVTRRGPYYDALYQRYGLTYSINKHFGIGINLKAHRQVANFFDGRLIYSFH